jgi:hypothetical protein
LKIKKAADSFNTIIQGKQIEIIETFKFEIFDNNETVVEYNTKTKYGRKQYSIYGSVNLR